MKKISEETIKQAAKMMGRRGGLQTSVNHGHEFYVEIGRKGGSSKGKNKLNEDEK
jgi:general stress protein YciG